MPDVVGGSPIHRRIQSPQRLFSEQTCTLREEKVERRPQERHSLLRWQASTLGLPGGIGSEASPAVQCLESPIVMSVPAGYDWP